MDIRYELKGVLFCWDDEKASANIRKHKISFGQAAQAFFDPFSKTVDASRNHEARNALMGFDDTGRLLFVVHLLIEDDSIRLISARRATNDERKDHDQNF